MDGYFFHAGSRNVFLVDCRWGNAFHRIWNVRISQSDIFLDFEKIKSVQVSFSDIVQNFTNLETNGLTLNPVYRTVLAFFRREH